MKYYFIKDTIVASWLIGLQCGDGLHNCLNCKKITQLFWLPSDLYVPPPSQRRDTQLIRTWPFALFSKWNVSRIRQKLQEASQVAGALLTFFPLSWAWPNLRPSRAPGIRRNMEQCPRSQPATPDMWQQARCLLLPTTEIWGLFLMQQIWLIHHVSPD